MKIYHNEEAVLFYNSSGQFATHTNKTEMIIKLNSNLRTLAGEYGHQYVDLFSLMADKNNHLPKSYSFVAYHTDPFEKRFGFSAQNNDFCHAVLKGGMLVSNAYN